MTKAKVIPFLMGFGVALVLARLPQTRTLLTGGNKFFG